ncbi:sodium:solute symporter family protein [Flavilitoribacter nigricans]|uniref:Na+:solute symporter n=1 Tax=Flavilitoribacter nigricans (strain ATCC 23147 / DSM 23189 / NBRC 102662 / NCIMB 1420 / SS-2) TaxID=1122177 RepID=A0A2D0NB89_FLAN2|nr:sodium:solute symporter family protein [Flavilitoribacter nigricans]PHN05648.1 Na+:solute symporter [Flavilitoribacter nigricans DSM 23189 = NBRC 102662]
MNFSSLDWSIIIAFFAVSLAVGLIVSRRAGSSASEFFLSGRNMPWWLLGVSMVATTFSSDTPNLVTGLVRENGVAGNWGWWAFLLTGMLTVFVFAKLWRRSGVMTDIEFYELRYSGKPAAFLRGFRALYLGLIFNVLVMGTVSLAAVKFGQIMLGWPGWQTLLIAGSITLAYSVIGGLKAVIITDFVQFVLAMIGSIWACIYLVNLPEVGGLDGLFTHAEVSSKLSLLPDFSNPSVWVPVILVPLAVQWWASYYPGSEPGGGGYIAQRMFSAKSEKGAIQATLFFNVAHYALRPWPWILIALASIVVFPELSDIQAAFPTLSDDKLGHDVAYPAMLTLLPSGLLGLVAASLIAAFMSTISTQLNLGASYLVNDFYQRFINPDASEKQLVSTGRWITLLTMILGVGLGLVLTDATQAFNLLLLLGAGTGLIYILRWFWWRINAYTEIIAMVSSIFIAGYFTFLHDRIGFFPLEDWQKTILGAALTTGIWIASTYLTPTTHTEKLFDFYRLIKPAGPGWNHVVDQAKAQGVSLPEVNGQLPLEILCMFVGCITVYGALFATGFWIYGETTSAIIASVVALGGGAFLFSVWKKLRTQMDIN